MRINTMINIPKQIKPVVMMAMIIVLFTDSVKKQTKEQKCDEKKNYKAEKKSYC